MVRYAHHKIWDLYSDKMHSLIKEHAHAGSCQSKEYENAKLGIKFKLALDYDAEKEHFTDLKYQLEGPSFMIAFFEGLAQIVVNQPVKSLARLRADDILEKINAYELAIDYHDEEITDYIRYISRYLNVIIDAYFEIFEELVGNVYTTPEALANFEIEGEGIANFFDLSKEEQIRLIDEVMEKDIRPYVALDEGNVKIKDLTKGGVLLIQYEGNCTSCHASGSTTLSAITQILNAKVHPELQVLPVTG